MGHLRTLKEVFIVTDQKKWQEKWDELEQEEVVERENLFSIGDKVWYTNMAGEPEPVIIEGIDFPYYSIKRPKYGNDRIHLIYLQDKYPEGQKDYSLNPYVIPTKEGTDE